MSTINSFLERNPYDATQRIDYPLEPPLQRDGTEDIAVICDGNGEDLLSSRHLWLPTGDDPVPPTLTFVRLATAAPRLFAALAAILPYAENESRSLYECWKRDGDEATKEELDACECAIEQARSVITAAGIECPHCKPYRLDIHAIPTARREIAAGWSIEDVQEIRPDLTDEQAWDVLQAVLQHHDATIGINWDVLQYHADKLFGDAPETDEGTEA